MAHVDVTTDTVHVRLGRWERIGALHGDLSFPRDAVRAAQEVEHPMKQLRGLRAPGYGMPGHGAVGTWRGRGWKEFSVAYAKQPGVVLDLDPGHADGFRRLIVSVDDPGRLVHALGARPSS
jgi:hypothetical protein